jgi:Fucose permease
MALCGGMLMPWVTGIVGGQYGMRGSFLVVPAALAILVVLLGILTRALRGEQTAQATS